MTEQKEKFLPKYSQSEIEEKEAFLDKFGIDTTDLSQEEVIQKFDKIQKIRVEKVQVLSLGPVNDGLKRLLKHVPKGFVGEFKRERFDDIANARALGFIVFEDKDVALESETGSADGKIRLGDQILMIIPEEEWAALKLAEIDSRRRKRDNRDYVMGRKGKRPTQGQADPDVPLIPL